VDRYPYNETVKISCDLSLNSENSDLRFEAWKPVFVKRDMAVYIVNDLTSFKMRFYDAWYNEAPLRILTLQSSSSVCMWKNKHWIVLYSYVLLYYRISSFHQNTRSFFESNLNIKCYVLRYIQVFRTYGRIMLHNSHIKNLNAYII
jgi:hypothetical protein